MYVGVQRRNNPREWLDLQPGDAEAVTWEFDARMIERDSGLDVLGPHVQGGPGQRFVYLSWGALDAAGEFSMFRRAKLFIAGIDDTTMRAASHTGSLVGRVGPTDARKESGLRAATQCLVGRLAAPRGPHPTTNDNPSRTKIWQ